MTDTQRMDWLSKLPDFEQHPWATLHTLSRLPTKHWPAGVYRFDLRAAIDAAMHEEASHVA